MKKLKQGLFIITFLIFNISLLLLFFVDFNKSYNWNISNKEYVFWTLATGNSNYQILQKNESAIIFDCGIGGAPKYWDKKQYGQNDFVISLMKKMNIKKIESIFISHYHTDHYNNLIALSYQDKIKIENILLPFNWDIVSGKKQQEIVKTIRKKYKTNILNFDKSYNFLGLNINNITWFAHDYLSNLNPYSNQNNFSYVFDFKIMNRSFLVTGDIEEPLYDAIDKTNRWDFIEQVDILTLPHHGSKASATIKMLNRFIVKNIIISGTSTEDKNWLPYTGSPTHNFPDKQIYDALKNMEITSVYLTGARPSYWTFKNFNKTFSYHLNIKKNVEYFKSHDFTIVKNI